MSPPPLTPRRPALTSLEPVPELIRRVRAELSDGFIPGRPMRVARAPGRLDVMGGIADYTGSLVCEATLDRAAAVAIQRRDDRTVQVFSFNLLDEHKPFTFIASLDQIASATIEQLRAHFNADPASRWAGYLIGCLAILRDENLIDLADPSINGFNLALLSTVPLGAGVSSSAAIEVATMSGLIDEFNLRPRLTPMKLAAMCQRVENQVVGAPCGIMDQATSCAGETGSLLRLLCQPHELQTPLDFPAGVRAVGINSHVKHSVGGGMYGKTRCAAFMGHKMILEKMRQMGAAAGKQLIKDPMNGYLANLPLEDYKRYFRSFLPEYLKGGQFLLQYHSTIDQATSVDPDFNYPVQHATDHHVFEASRVRNFVQFLEQAHALNADDPERKKLLDKAGHLMYASHISYTEDAMLGAEECSLLVDLARQREHAGLYGAKITGGGAGGTVAILCDQSDTANRAILEIMKTYEEKIGQKPEAFLASSPGAWGMGTMEI